MCVRMAVTRGSKVYSEKKLWHITEDEPVYIIPFGMLSHNLDLDRWTIYVDGREKYITPNEVLADPSVSPEDYKKIIFADLKYPILVCNDDGFLDILDGLHRLALLAMQGAPEVNIKFVTKPMLDMARYDEL